MQTRKKLWALLAALTVVFYLPSAAMASTNRTFGAGSMVIPMDSHYQPMGVDTDRGILEAYGMVYWLLGHEDEWGNKLNLRVYWIIDDAKATIDAPDLTITADTTKVDPKDNPDVLPDYIAGHYDNGTGGIDASDNILTPTVTEFVANSGVVTAAELKYLSGDDAYKMTYGGGPFIIDGPDVPQALQLINDYKKADGTLVWKDVEKHIINVEFDAPVYKELFGTPPRIALMNDVEEADRKQRKASDGDIILDSTCTQVVASKDDLIYELVDGVCLPAWDGNAVDILEPYLRMAGVCSSNYDILYPYTDIAGDGKVVDATNNTMDLSKSKLMTGNNGKPYNFLWAPHWAGHEKADYIADWDSDGKVNADEIVKTVRAFVEQGGDLFAECASIQSFEHSSDGLFLTNIGIAHNGGTNNAADIIYNYPEAAYVQADIGFVPESGHLHNWRPFINSDSSLYDITDFNDPTSWATPPYLENVTSTKNSSYKATVKEYIEDNTGWDYYVGGYMDGNPNKGYVTYLGGHKYHDGACASAPAAPAAGQSADCTSNNETCPLADVSAGEDPMDHLAGVRYVLNTLLNLELVVADEEFSRAGPVVDGVIEIVTDASNVQHSYDYDLIYQGTFNNPSYTGSFRKTKRLAKIDGITQTNPPDPVVVWDVGEPSQGLIPPALTGNSADGARQVFTALPDLQNNLVKADFDIANISNLLTPLAITPANNDNSDEEVVIERLRGKKYNKVQKQWLDHPNNRMGGVVHSVPAVTTFNSRTGYVKEYNTTSGTWVTKTVSVNGVDVPVKRPDVAYVGDYRGMLHAFRTTDEKDASGNVISGKQGGKELWAFIPGNLLGLLKNDRADTDLNAPGYPAVDSSPNLIDVYVTNYDLDEDHDADPATGDGPFTGWRTILTVAEGTAGDTVIALDVTNPDPAKIRVLWEKNGVSDGSGNNIPMGGSHRVSIGKLQVTLYKDADGVNVSEGFVYQSGSQLVWDNGSKEVPVHPYDFKNLYAAFIATNFPDGTGYGIKVFAVDLLSGDPIWAAPFEQTNPSSHNDMPDAVAVFDKNGDSYADWLFLGDSEGRMWQIDAKLGTNVHGVSTGTSATFVDSPPGALTDLTTNPLTGLPEAGKSNLLDTSNKLIQQDVPLFKTSGATRPITGTPAVVRSAGGEVIVIFGTGGEDWVTADGNNLQYIYAINATALRSQPYDFNIGAGTPEWAFALQIGEKMYDSPIFADGWIYFETTTGTLNSGNPRADQDGAGNLYALKLTAPSNHHHTATTKGGSSITQRDGRIVLVDKDGNVIIQDESGNTAGLNKRLGVTIRSWHSM